MTSRSRWRDQPRGSSCGEIAARGQPRQLIPAPAGFWLSISCGNLGVLAHLSLIDAGVITITGDTAVFTKDHLFRTPSGAACAVLGRTANGWIECRTKDGRTLDAVKRQSLQISARRVLSLRL